MTTGGTEEEADGESGPKGKERWRGSLRPKKEITHQRWERGKVAGASYAHCSRHVSTQCSTPTERADQSHDILQHEAVAMG